MIGAAYPDSEAGVALGNREKTAQSGKSPKEGLAWSHQPNRGIKSPKPGDGNAAKGIPLTALTANVFNHLQISRALELVEKLWHLPEVFHPTASVKRVRAERSPPSTVS